MSSSAFFDQFDSESPNEFNLIAIVPILILFRAMGVPVFLIAKNVLFIIVPSNAM